jgi:hypothetical protein
MKTAPATDSSMTPRRKNGRVIKVSNWLGDNDQPSPHGRFIIPFDISVMARPE